MDIFGGKRFFVYGDGLSGRAARRAIKKLGGSANIYTDVNGAFCPPAEKKYDGAVISPGIRPTHAVYEYCSKRGIKTLSEIEIGFAASTVPIVGVTGTNGKTTVTRMIASMIGGTACGNIGYPVSTAALKKHKALVCELSSFQLHNAVISPKVAVITNIAADHLDWHGDMRDYCASKCNIANNMRGILVLGEDIPISALDSLKTEAQIVRCSTTRVCDGAYIDGGYFCYMGNRVCPIDYLRLPGAHNIKNALCAIAASKSMGADNGAILSALSAISPSPHRTESAGYACGKLWIDDSKGTNISASLAAIDATPGNICLILGGRGKGTDFNELFSALDGRVTEIVAMGETAPEILDCANRCEIKRQLTAVNCLADAVLVAARSNAETVLLSPACASFDEFKDYAQRGEKFKRAVIALAKSQKRRTQNPPTDRDE